MKIKLRIIIGLAFAALPTSAIAQNASARDNVLMAEDPEQREAQASWGYAEAVISGEMIYLSGVATGLQGPDDTVEASLRRMFDQVENVLRRAGSSWDDVLEMTSYHTDFASQLRTMLAVKRDYVRAPYPAWTAVGVTRLAEPSAIAEVKIVAKRAKRKAP